MSFALGFNNFLDETQELLQSAGATADKSSGVKKTPAELRQTLKNSAKKLADEVKEDNTEFKDLTGKVLKLTDMIDQNDHMPNIIAEIANLASEAARIAIYSRSDDATIIGILSKSSALVSHTYELFDKYDGPFFQAFDEYTDALYDGYTDFRLELKDNYRESQTMPSKIAALTYLIKESAGDIIEALQYGYNATATFFKSVFEPEAEDSISYASVDDYPTELHDTSLNPEDQTTTEDFANEHMA